MSSPGDSFAQRERKKLACEHPMWTIRCTECGRLCASEITAQDWLDTKSAIAYLETRGYTTKFQQLARDADIPGHF